MNRYYLRNWSNGEKLTIEAMHREVTKMYDQEFYQDKEGKIMTQSYPTRFYVVYLVEYNIN
tara:strand:+ start:268 stop:450 length:183 start_codon:yes stop_codon:yes gene_type:complete